MSVESHWSAYYVAAAVVKQRGDKAGGWKAAAEAHLDAYFDAIETEAQESVFDQGPKWHGLGSLKAWCFPNPLDHRAARKPKKANH